MTSLTPAPPDAPAAVGALPFLLPFVVYLVHTLEELQGFAGWATKHFGPETTGMFAAYHIPLMLLVGYCSWRAVGADRLSGWAVAAAAFQWQFGLNALFHLITWVVLAEYSPGAVTAAVVSLPTTVLFFAWVRRERRITRRQSFAAAVIGTGIAGLAIGFLFL